MMNAERFAFHEELFYPEIVEPHRHHRLLEGIRKRRRGRWEVKVPQRETLDLGETILHVRIEAMIAIEEETETEEAIEIVTEEEAEIAVDVAAGVAEVFLTEIVGGVLPKGDLIPIVAAADLLIGGDETITVIVGHPWEVAKETMII